MQLSDLLLPQEKWIDITIGDKQCQLLIRSKDNDDYRLFQDNVIRRFDKAEKDDKLEPVDVVDESRKNIARNIIKDWDGIYDADGNRVPYNPDEMLRVFRQNSALLDKVIREANQIQEDNDSLFSDTVKKL